MTRSLALKLALAAFLFVAAGCTPAPRAPDAAADRAAVAAAMERYMTAARKVDAAGMAAFFTPTGVLFEPGIFPIVTRDSIRAFLSSFPGATVDSATAVPDTIEVWDGTALLWGSYFERLSFPGQPVSEQHGKFVIEWVRQADGAWLIERYYRVPLPSSPAPAPKS